MMTDGELRRLALEVRHAPDEEMGRRFQEATAGLKPDELTRFARALSELNDLYASLIGERGRRVYEGLGIETTATEGAAGLAWTARCLVCGREWPMEPYHEGGRPRLPPGWLHCPNGCNSDR